MSGQTANWSRELHFKILGFLLTKGITAMLVMSCLKFMHLDNDLSAGTMYSCHYML